MILVYNVWLDFRGHAENTMLCGRVDIDKLLVGFVNNTRKVITFCARLYSRPTTLFLRASNNIYADNQAIIIVITFAYMQPTLAVFSALNNMASQPCGLLLFVGKYVYIYILPSEVRPSLSS